MHRTASPRAVLFLVSIAASAVSAAACVPPDSETVTGGTAGTGGTGGTGGTTTTDTTTTDTDTTTTTTAEPDPCGNGVLDPGEECDDGNTDPTDDCTSICTNAFCGDGFVHASSEVCDGDGCDPTCSEVLPVLQVTGYCALLFDGRVKCWGHGLYGAVGLGDTGDRGDQPGEMGVHLPAVDLGTGAVAVQLTSGYAHNCARMQDGRLKCWGNNGPGPSGVVSPGPDAYIGNGPDEMGDNDPYVDVGTGRTVLSVQAGRGHTCAILDDHSLKCWGLNASGQLGQGDKENRGKWPGTMGDDLPPVDLGTGKYAVQVAPADYHTCALLNDATVKCWGQNLYGQLGLGDKVYRGNQPGQMGDNLPTVDLGNVTPVAIAGGGDVACVLLDTGRVRCWGRNSCNEVGHGGGAVGDDPSDMGDNLVDVPLPPAAKAIAVVVGNGAACAQLDNGEMRCWGCDFDGQLGLADSPPSMYKQAVNLGTGKTAAQIYIGYPRACAVLDDGTLKCWGNNSVGQLGLGDTKARGENTNTMGDKLPIVHVYDDRW